MASALAEPPKVRCSASSLHVAEAFLKSDPYLIDGLVKARRRQKWNTVAA
jgi:hypothetical protein